MAQIEVKLRGVHKILNNANKKLSKSKDPAAAKLMADMQTFNAKSKCGQSNVFRFNS